MKPLEQEISLILNCAKQLESAGTQPSMRSKSLLVYSLPDPHHANNEPATVLAAAMKTNRLDASDGLYIVKVTHQQLKGFSQNQESFFSSFDHSWNKCDIRTRDRLWNALLRAYFLQEMHRSPNATVAYGRQAFGTFRLECHFRSEQPSQYLKNFANGLRTLNK